MTDRVWLIGDDAGVAERLDAWISDAGSPCERLTSREAVSRLTDGGGPIKAAVVDAGDGHAVLALLEALGRRCKTTVLLVDAECYREIAAALAAGIGTFLRKPVEPAALAAALTVEGRAERPGSGRFLFRTLDDVLDLSQLVAGLCPDPAAVEIGLSELMLNAVEHGNLGIGFERKGHLMNAGTWRQELERLLRLPENLVRFGYLDVELRGDGVRFKVLDQGSGFDPQPYMNFNPERSVALHGRGIAIARMLAFPDLHFREEGSCVEGLVRRVC